VIGEAALIDAQGCEAADSTRAAEISAEGMS